MGNEEASHPFVDCELAMLASFRTTTHCLLGNGNEGYNPLWTAKGVFVLQSQTVPSFRTMKCYLGCVAVDGDWGLGRGCCERV